MKPTRCPDLIEESKRRSIEMGMPPVRRACVSVQPLSEEVYNEKAPPRAKAAAEAAAKAALFGIGQASHSSNPTQSAAKLSPAQEATLQAEHAARVASVVARIGAGEDVFEVLNDMRAEETGVPPASSGSNAKAEEQKHGEDVD